MPQIAQEKVVRMHLNAKETILIQFDKFSSFVN